MGSRRIRSWGHLYRRLYARCRNTRASIPNCGKCWLSYQRDESSWPHSKGQCSPDKSSTCASTTRHESCSQKDETFCNGNYKQENHSWWHENLYSRLFFCPAMLHQAKIDNLPSTARSNRESLRKGRACNFSYIDCRFLKSMHRCQHSTSTGCG